MKLRFFPLEIYEHAEGERKKIEAGIYNLQDLGKYGEVECFHENGWIVSEKEKPVNLNDERVNIIWIYQGNQLVALQINDQDKDQIVPIPDEREPAPPGERVNVSHGDNQENNDCIVDEDISYPGEIGIHNYQNIVE